MLFSSRFANRLSYPSAPAYRTGQTFDGTSGSISSTQKKFGSYSLLLQGYVTDRFTTVNHNDTKFTLEGWFYYSTANGSGYSGSFFGGRNSSNSSTSFGLALYSNNTITLAQRDGTNQDFVLGTTLSTGAWHHISITRSGNTVRLFIDGTQRGGDKTFTGTFLSSGDKLIIGSSSLQSSWFSTAYADEVRLSKTVRYEANSLIPQAALSNDEDTVLLTHCEAYPLVDDTSAYPVYSPATDSYWANTVLLMGMNNRVLDDTGRHTFTDTINSTTPYAPPFTANTASYSTSVVKFGSHSKTYEYNEWTQILDNTADFQFGTGDFTIECWFYHPSGQSWGGNKVLFSINRENNGVNGGPNILGLTARTSTGFKPAFYLNDSFGYTAFPAELANNTWHHIAVSRVSSQIYFAYNGTVTNPGSSSKNITYVTSGIWIKRDYWSGEEDYLCHIDELRVTKGVGRYTSNYTVPAAPFPRS